MSTQVDEFQMNIVVINGFRAAFVRHTNEYISLNDGEIAVITPTDVGLDKSRMERSEKEDILLSPDPFPHWTIRGKSYSQKYCTLVDMF